MPSVLVKSYHHARYSSLTFATNFVAISAVNFFVRLFKIPLFPSIFPILALLASPSQISSTFYFILFFSFLVIWFLNFSILHIFSWYYLTSSQIAPSVTSWSWLPPNALADLPHRFTVMNNQINWLLNVRWFFSADWWEWGGRGGEGGGRPFNTLNNPENDVMHFPTIPTRQMTSFSYSATPLFTRDSQAMEEFLSYNIRHHFGRNT